MGLGFGEVPLHDGDLHELVLDVGQGGGFVFGGLLNGEQDLARFFGIHVQEVSREVELGADPEGRVFGGGGGGAAEPCDSFWQVGGDVHFGDAQRVVKLGDVEHGFGDLGVVGEVVDEGLVILHELVAADLGDGLVAKGVEAGFHCVRGGSMSCGGSGGWIGGGEVEWDGVAGGISGRQVEGCGDGEGGVGVGGGEVDLDGRGCEVDAAVVAGEADGDVSAALGVGGGVGEGGGGGSNVPAVVADGQHSRIDFGGDGGVGDGFARGVEHEDVEFDDGDLLEFKIDHQILAGGEIDIDGAVGGEIALEIAGAVDLVAWAGDVADLVSALGVGVGDAVVVGEYVDVGNGLMGLFVADVAGERGEILVEGDGFGFAEVVIMYEGDGTFDIRSA